MVAVSYYDILEIPPDASAGEINSAYRRTALVVHPDRAPGASRFFRLVQEAYEVLSDPGRRAHYDDELAGRSDRLAEPPGPQSRPRKSRATPDHYPPPTDQHPLRKRLTLNVGALWVVWGLLSGVAVWGLGQFGGLVRILAISFVAAMLIAIVTQARWRMPLLYGCWILSGMWCFISIGTWNTGHPAAAALVAAGLFVVWGLASLLLAKIYTEG